MGTFDSIYQHKIRRLEEENRQLRNLISEDFGLTVLGARAVEAAVRALKRRRNNSNQEQEAVPRNRKPSQGTPAPTGGAGGTPLVPKPTQPTQLPPPIPTMIPQPLYPGYTTVPVPMPGGLNIPVPVRNTDN